MWVVILAALGILIHALVCKSCHMGSHRMMGMPSKGRKR
jgi:hypothetical protein